MMKPILRALGLSALLACGSAQASLIQNGGFEAQPDPTQGWTLSGNTAFSFFDGFAPRSGAVGASFGAPPADPAWLSQSVSTVAGAHYTLSFWLQNGASGTVDEPNVFELNWDGGAPELLLSNADAFGYQRFEFEFQASSALTELRFGFGNYLSYWDFDDVALAQVPLPSGLALAGLGLLLAAGVRLRR